MKLILFSNIVILIGQKTGRFYNFEEISEPKPSIFDFSPMLVPIQITPKAEAEIKHIMANKNIPENYFLRVGVKGGGCGGMSYALGFDKSKPEDQEFEIAGIPVLIEKRHFMFLMGMQIDFFEGDEARGFTFVNPDLPKRHDL